MNVNIAVLAGSAILFGLATVSPAQAKFVSVDPVTYPEDGRPGMVNRYSYALNDPINFTDPDGRQVFPRQDGRTIIVYPQKTADHVDKRHSPNAVGPQNKYTRTLGKNTGQAMAMRTIERAVANETVTQDNGANIYESEPAGIFAGLTSVGTAGEDTNRVVTRDLETMFDPVILEQVAQELATPESVATLAGLEAAAPSNSEPIEIEVIVTQYPVHDEDRLTGR